MLALQPLTFTQRESHVKNTSVTRVEKQTSAPATLSNQGHSTMNIHCVNQSSYTNALLSR